MAGIDKTYTDSYKDYKEFKDWADKQTITFFSGYKVYVGDCIYEPEEDYFTEDEIPVMNSATWLDAWLLQNCKVPFVIDRLNDVYSADSISKMLSIDFAAKPSEIYQKNRKIVVKRYKYTKYPIHNYPLNCVGKVRWWLQSNGNLWYCTESKTWLSKEQWHPYDTNTSHPTTVKAMVRQLRKQYLPKGVTFTLSGSLKGERYLVEVK